MSSSADPARGAMTAMEEALGYGRGARLLIPHIDDIGCAHGTVTATRDLFGGGFVTTGSVMVPCTWFPDVVATAADRPDLDLGIHLTLTSESSAARWRPISTTSRASGLIDDDGYMWSDVPSLRAHAARSAVEDELRAQIEAAISAGIDVTHLDHHMGAALSPEFAAVTLDLAAEYGTPVLFPTRLAEYVDSLNMGDLDIVTLDALRDGHAPGVLFADTFEIGLNSLGEPCEDVYRRIIRRADPGITFLSLHASAPGDIEAVHPKDHEWRVAERRLFEDTGFLAWVDEQDVHLVGIREIRDLVIN